MEHLTQPQRDAVSQLQALTNATDPDAATALLESVGWDVQQAANLIFDGDVQPAPSTSTARPKTPEFPRMEQFEIDDSEVAPLTSARRPPGSSNIIWTILALPLNMLSGILRFVLGILRVPFPALLTNFNLNFAGYRPLAGPSSDLDPRTAAERWVRALEEETGAQALSSASASGVEGAAGSGMVRRGAPGAGEKVLPDFMRASYEQMLRLCEREARVGVVVLVSEEHDDDTLTDARFVQLLVENDFVCWGGDVREREAWMTAQKLQAMTYPFVAFVALQPQRGASRAANATGTLTVLSRHEGAAKTAPAALVAHIEGVLLPRVGPFLERAKAARVQREVEERVRAQEREVRRTQEEAFERSLRADRERIQAGRAKEARERREREEAARREAEARAERERVRGERVLRAARREGWRRWAVGALVPREARVGGVRVAVRMPGGERRIRTFAKEESLTGLYAWVDVSMIGVSTPDAEAGPPEGTPRDEGEIGAIEVAEGEGRVVGFALVNAYPRKEVPWAPGVKLGEVKMLEGGAQLVVEMKRQVEDEQGDGTASEDEDVSEEE